eukprot:TRINITY_DN3676_c0_g1_i4.p1 TRINITY_DN3676_c0_g1~~TRINITY_DN3676_c0_g1_i4.p1  ORF type:complete len:869 (-),score=363.99 TRINITY_DN3676_c0_g1_i4:107-2713(-)
MDEKEFQRMMDQFNKENALNPAELKALGIDGDDDEDPELAALMKEGDKIFNPRAGSGMKDIDIDKVDLNDADLDDPELLKEIGELGGEDSKQELEAARGRLARIEADIKASLSQAVNYKKQNNTQEALKYLKAKKQLEAEKKKLLEEHPELALQPKPEPSKPEAPPQGTAPAKKEAKKESKSQQVKQQVTAVADIKDVGTLDMDTLETEVHSVEKIEAVSVLDEEIKLMKAKAAKSTKEDAEFYREKKEQLEFRRNMLVNSIQSGFTSQDAYMKAIQKEIAYERGLLEMLKRNSAKSEDIKRVESRIKLIEVEMQPPEEKEEEEPKEEKKEVAEVKKTQQPEAKRAPQPEVKKTGVKPKMEAKKEVKALNETSVIKSHLIIDEANTDFTNIDKEQYNTVLQRLKDYVAATEYFLNNSMEKDAERLVRKVKRLKICLQIVKDGKRIDLLKIEPPLRPEIMFGKDLKTRIAEFQTLIGKLQEQMANENKLAKSYIEKAKKDKSVKVLAENEVKNVKESKILVEKVKANMKNQWQPIPLHKEVITHSEVEIIRRDIGSSDLLVEYAPNHDLAGKSGYTMEYYIRAKDDEKKGSFDPHKKGDFKLSFSKAIRQIEKGEATFELKGKALLLFSKDCGKLSVKLDKFATVGKIPVEFTDSSGKLKLAIALLIQKPTKGKEVRKIENKKLTVTRFYPAFNPASPSPAEASQPTAVARHELEEIKHPVPSAPAASKAAAQGSAKDPPLPSSLPNMPGGITEADVKDPDDPGNLVCCSYLEKRIATYNEMVKQLAGKGQQVPPAVKDKLMIMNRNKAIIESQIESGKLTPEAYKGFLETQLKKDMILITYLKTLNQNSKMATVKIRIDCIEAELKSF